MLSPDIQAGDAVYIRAQAQEERDKMDASVQKVVYIKDGDALIQPLFEKARVQKIRRDGQTNAVRNVGDLWKSKFF